ncbi:MAG: hypothetical protein M3Z04_25070, partial [Chloroflexota bacterium]|nr:hypothetical protein [Chloroflexota bacterium]
AGCAAPAAQSHPPDRLVAWATSPAALEQWCAGQPPIHDVLDHRHRPMRWADHAPPRGTRFTCAACGVADQPYLHDDGACDSCTALTPLVLEFSGYAAVCKPGGPWTPQGPRPAQQLNALLLDYGIAPTAVGPILPGLTSVAHDATGSTERSSLIVLLTVPRHVAHHILHGLAHDNG